MHTRKIFDMRPQRFAIDTRRTLRWGVPPRHKDLHAEARQTGFESFNLAPKQYFTLRAKRSQKCDRPRMGGIGCSGEHAHDRCHADATGDEQEPARADIFRQINSEFTMRSAEPQSLP